MCGWMWHPAHQFADSTLHKENTHPEMISLVRGKSGSLQWVSPIQIHSGLHVILMDPAACQPPPASVSLNHVPAETQGGLWKTWWPGTLLSRDREHLAGHRDERGSLT